MAMLTRASSGGTLEGLADMTAGLAVAAGVGWIDTGEGVTAGVATRSGM